MSFSVNALPLTLLAAAFAVACADVSSPTQSVAPTAGLASKGSGSGGTSGGGGSNGGSSGGTQLVVTTPPTVNTTGTWMGTTDGPDVTHTYTYTLSQNGAGIVSGVGTIVTPFTTVTELVAGTVSGDTLMLYVGTVCGSCTLNPLYRGIVSSNSTRVDGSFVQGGVSPLTLFKQ